MRKFGRDKYQHGVISQLTWSCAHLCPVLSSSEHLEPVIVGSTRTANLQMQCEENSLVGGLPLWHSIPLH